MSLGGPDYFVNLERNRRFPWSLYHQPIEDDLEAFLQAVAAELGLPHAATAGPNLGKIKQQFHRRVIELLGSS